MKMSEVQAYVQSLIEAHPVFAAIGLKTIADDGTYPKLPAREMTLMQTGLAIIVWRVTSLGLIDTNRTGASNQLLHIAVIIQENTTVNRGAAAAGVTPTGILPLDAYQYVTEAISGHPRNTPPGTPIMPHSEPFDDLGKNNGVWTIAANFTKEHRITPI